MVDKVAKVQPLENFDEAREDLVYWLSRPAEERLEAVVLLSDQFYENTAGIQRVVRIVQLSRS